MNSPLTAQTGAAALARVRVVLVETSHPGNIGSAARAMMTMGLSRLQLVQPAQFPSGRATALASGAAAVLDNAGVHTTLDQALSGARLCVGVTARKRNLATSMLTCREAAQKVIEEAQHGDVALVFGPEIVGLSNDDLDRCQLLLTIPANPQYSSLNLAASVQVVAYELRMAALGETGFALGLQDFQDELISHDDAESFYQHLERVLYEIEFLRPEQPNRIMRRLRRLFARTRLERDEVNILRGILTQITKKNG